MQHILSIQSWVAFGHVGNAAAMFPLQRLGFEVSAIHTVQFSNHTGYKTFRGMVFSPEHLSEVVQGMEENQALDYDAVLSGYIGSSATAEVILNSLNKIRKNKPTLYCCDPVMGDLERGIFVQSDIPAVIKQKVIPQADILTPNHFELELLTGQTIETLEDSLHACQEVRSWLHPRGPKIVLLTSLLRKDAPPDSIETLVMNGLEAWLVSTPYIPLKPSPSGTGDVIAALFLGHYLKTGSISVSLENAVSALYNLLLLTYQNQSKEIQLIAAQDMFINPSQRFKAQKVDFV